ncbi:MAG: hypothetical protein JRM88_02990 [Nitrososphaerota archaeon]|nr:hypothetical protein [Nitrososphaerota archaeon]
MVVKAEQVPDEHDVAPVTPVNWYPDGRESTKEQDGFIVMLWEEPSPGKVDGEGLHPVMVIVCCEPPFTLLKAAVIGWVTAVATTS